MNISRRSLITGLSLLAVGFGYANAAPKAPVKGQSACQAACLACAEACQKCIAEHKGQADCCSLCEVCRNLCLACAAADGKEVEEIVRAACEKVCRKCAEHCKLVDDATSKACSQACIACAESCKADRK